MADAEQNTDKNAEGAKAKGSMLPWILVGLGAGMAGAAIPVGLTLMAGTSATPNTTEAPLVKAPSVKEMTIVSYGQVTVNLNEDRMGRYMAIDISLYVRSADESAVTKAIEDKRLIIKDWLVNHLSDKSLADVKGAAGQNRVRREIRDYFNQTLLADSYDPVYDVLFTDFKIQ